MYNGARSSAKAEDADIVLELRSGGVGTDMADSYVGIPEIVLPGMMTLPQVKFITRTNQSAVAKIGLVAYDAKSQEMLGGGGVCRRSRMTITGSCWAWGHIKTAP